MARKPATESASTSGAPVGVPGVVILHGADRFLQLQATAALRAELESRTPGGLDVLTFDGQSTRVADILDELRSFGLMAQHKLVVVDNADQLLSEPDEESDAPAASGPGRRRGAGGTGGGGGGEKSARELLESYAAAPETMSTLVLRAGTFKGPRLEKAVLAGGGRVSKCAPPGPADAAAWAVRWAKSQHSATLTPDGARALIEALGTDMGRIDTELAKLAVAAQARGGGRAAIDAALVAELSADTHEQRLWSIQAALLSGDPARALGELNHMIDVLRENPVGIGLAYLDLARKLDSAARGLAARESRPSIIGRLRLWGETVNPLLDAAAACGPAVTTPLLAAAVETDARSKSGGGDPRRLLEALTLRFTSLRR